MYCWYTGCNELASDIPYCYVIYSVAKVIAVLYCTLQSLDGMWLLSTTFVSDGVVSNIVVVAAPPFFFIHTHKVLERNYCNNST